MVINHLIKELRQIAKIGLVHGKHDLDVIAEAADVIERLDERVSIVYEMKDGDTCGLLEDDA